MVAATAASINFTGGGVSAAELLLSLYRYKKTGVLYDAAAVYLSTASPD